MNPSRNVRRSSDEMTRLEDTFPAAEKILSDIENVIKKDSELTSFEIIPVQDNENKSPVYHEEHSLGLASWCVQPLYCYAYSRLSDQRRSDHRREEPSTVSRWLTGALLLNPDVSTFWNMKRELVRNGRLDASTELRFSTIVLFHKAKCFEAFAYRRWLVHYLLVGPGKSPTNDVETLLANEIIVAGVSADRYANNYHAWSHREYVVCCHEKNLPDSYENLLKTEWKSSGEWCDRHVSDHSGLAYRQFVLRRLLFRVKNGDEDVSMKREIAERRDYVERFVYSSASGETRSQFGVDESWKFLNVLHNARMERRSNVDYDGTLVRLSYWAEDCKNNEAQISLFPGHEALWYHRRFLAQALAALDDSYRRDGSYGSNERNGRWHGFELDDDSAEKSPRVDGFSNDKPESNVGLLVRTFFKDNERIVDLSRNFASDRQTILGEKFVEYVRKFNFDPLKNEDG